MAYNLFASNFYASQHIVSLEIGILRFHYQATHGHEVMNKFWLRHFVGYDGTQKLKYGKDIDAVAGATISAQALMDDLDLVLRKISSDCL